MRRDTMNDGIIQADAGRAREAIQTQEIGSCTVAHDKVVDDFVDLSGGDTGFNMLRRRTSRQLR